MDASGLRAEEHFDTPETGIGKVQKEQTERPWYQVEIQGEDPPTARKTDRQTTCSSTESCECW